MGFWKQEIKHDAEGAPHLYSIFTPDEGEGCGVIRYVGPWTDPATVKPPVDPKLGTPVSIADIEPDTYAVASPDRRKEIDARFARPPQGNRRRLPEDRRAIL